MKTSIWAGRSVLVGLLLSCAFFCRADTAILTAPKPALAAERLAKGKAKEAKPNLSAGEKAPAFTAPLLNGKQVKFPDDYKGKVVLVDFWATWCGPCVAEIPNVVKAYDTYHEKGFEVLGISLDQENAKQKLAAFTEKHKMPWPQVYDGKFWKADVAQLYGISAIPHMILIDGDTGTILADDVRGEALPNAIEKGLAAKKK